MQNNFIKLIKVGFSLFEIKNNLPIKFTEFERYKNLGLNYPFMILFIDNIILEEIINNEIESNNDTDNEIESNNDTDNEIENKTKLNNIKTKKLKRNNDDLLLMLSYDLKYRLQYKYNKKHIEYSVEDKMGLVKNLIDDYINLINNIENDYLDDKLSYKKILAIMVLITLKTGIRIGKDYHYQQTGSVGLSTLRKEHLTFDKNNKYIELNFIGKKGVSYYYKLTNKNMGTNKYFYLLKELYNNTDDFIFKFNNKKIKYNDINLYIKQKTLNKDLSGKDFRTLLANLSYLNIIITKIKSIDIKITLTKLNNIIKESIDETASILQNTKNVSKKYYIFDIINQFIIDLFNNNSLSYLLKFENNEIILLKEILI